MTVRPEFADDVIAACVRHYRRPRDGHSGFAQFRRDGRSFPADYEPMSQELFSANDEETMRAHVVRVAAELDALGRIGKSRVLGRFRQARQSTRADKRVFAGPSELDVEALPHIEQAWCVAEFICADCGLRSDTWTKEGLRRTHVRYGMLLDWAARDVAQRLSRERDRLSVEDACARYGLDPVRVALEHGGEPDELDELAAASGLRRRGSLCPWAYGQSRRLAVTVRGDRLPQLDPGFQEIVALVDSTQAREVEALEE